MSPLELFWDWFVRHEHALRPEHIGRGEIAELETRLNAAIASPSSVDWEIGPFDGGQFFAVVPAPGLDDAIRAWIQAAPTLEGWTFLTAKPPRDWTLEFEIHVDGEDVAIDATRWELVLRREPATGRLDVLFKPDRALAGLPEDVLQHAGRIVVEGELGQARTSEVIRHVIVITDDWTEAEARAAQPLEPGVLRSAVDRAARSR